MPQFTPLLSVSDYLWDVPLIIFGESLASMPTESWQTGEGWIDVLNKSGADVLGLVLPLELKSHNHWRQSLHGFELLEWLRYSSDPSVNLCPVLVASWQPLQDTLRRRFEPLVVTEGCRLVRLPEAMKGDNRRLQDFVQQVRGTEAFQYREREESLKRLALGRADVAQSLTHHDLANDFFAAWRLWKGYLKALQDVAQSRTKNAEVNKALKDLYKSASKIEFAWQGGLEQKIRRPYFRQFCLSREQDSIAPYPEVESAYDIIRLHAQQGLSSDTRILFVDDEFDKGMADVLLQLLFGDAKDEALKFTTKGPKDSEWIYSESAARKTRDTQGNDHWARFVCVKDIDTAALWLKHWGEANLFKPERSKLPSIESRIDERNWVKSWAEFLETGANSSRDIKDLFGYQLNGKINLDKDGARPKTVNTFVILDLRLMRTSSEGDDSSLERDSKQFLKALKSQRPNIPVLMLTASRQANKYSDFMDSDQDDDDPQKADGWLIKEAPDAMTDDANSSRAACYLLDFIHLSARVNQWYRPSINWNQEVKQAYHEMWSSPYFDDCLKSVSKRADTYIDKLDDEAFKRANKGRKLLGSVQEEGENFKFEIEDRLVARRVAIWALLYSADWSGGIPSWNVKEFQNTLSCAPVGRPSKNPMKYPRDVLNFNTDLYLSSYTQKLLEMLLPEEYDWLEKQVWREKSKAKILNYLREVRAKEDV
jgi:hypothetical protein